jgi:transposase
MAVEILGRERRRRWSNAERLEIIAAVGVHGETLARVARRYDVSRSQIYQWRHQFRKRGLLPAPAGPTFLSVDIGAPMLSAEPVPEDRVVSPLMVELCLAQGRRLRFDICIEAAVLTRLIRSVEAA